MVGPKTEFLIKFWLVTGPLLAFIVLPWVGIALCNPFWRKTFFRWTDLHMHALVNWRNDIGFIKRANTKCKLFDILRSDIN